MMLGVNPMQLLDRLFMRNVDYETRLTKTYVDEPTKILSLFWRGVAGFVFALVLIVAMNVVSPDSFWFTLASVIVGMMLGRGAMRQFFRARAYRDGYLDGRVRMLTAMREAMERDMSIEEWLEGEVERDIEVLRWL